MPAAPHFPAPATFRWSWVWLVAALFAIPFLFVQVPPLVDVPGHIGRMAVAVAAPDSPLRTYFSYHWAPVLNLGSDLLIEGLRPLLGLIAATWLVCAAVPVITAAGTIAVARTLNPRGAHALPWALMFVLNWPFFYGFLNYSLAVGLSLLAFALWVRLSERRRLRAPLFLLILPLLMLGHAVGGGLVVVMIASHELWARGAFRPRHWKVSIALELTRVLWPLLAVLLAIGLWAGTGQPGHGRTVWLLERKPEAILMALRDQNMVVDIASVALALLVLLLGRFWGARFRGGNAGPPLAVFVLLLIVPAIITGADRIDTRLGPYAPLLALALQDWSAVEDRRRRLVLVAGSLLLAVRLMLTTVGFAQYERSYTSELSALDHVRSGSRVLSFTSVECKMSAWRLHRLEHLSNMASVYRHAWVNSHWVIDGVNALQVRYRPSEAYYRDPSGIVFPQRCIDMRVPPDKRSRKTIAETLQRAPVAGADYLWLINERLPAGYSGARLDKLWSNGTSELYSVRQPVPMRVPTP